MCMDEKKRLLEGKTAVITGSARGIGKAIAEEFAREGCNLVITDIDSENTQKTSEEIKKQGIEVISFCGDVSDSADVASLFKQTLDKFGKIDILVNNAGITRDNLLMRMSEEDWDLVIKVNLKGAFLCTKQAVRPMMKQRSGKIINIASVIGLMGNAGQANYAASKAGLIGLTQSAAKETASRNIQVNAIAPGFIETEMTANLDDEVKKGYLASIPAARGGLPLEVAKTAVFLASDASDYITGQTINVDGGLLIA
jgi:3-oxoacyl-[acyl-carrier protein] reductase